jgi:hypothetical protein
MTTTTIPVRPLAALKLGTLALLGLALLLLSSCRWAGVKGDGNVKTEDRPIADFTRLEADGAFTVNWTTGPAKLSITTDQNLMEYIRTDQSGDRLKIDWVKPLRGTDGIKINLASPRLARVNINGAVRLVGANLSGPELYLECNGASRVALQGNVNAVSAEMNGASRLDAESLSTRAMELSISGAGRAEVNASDVLKVEISGAGKVIYTGSPQVSKEISGAGSVKRRGE